MEVLTAGGLTTLIVQVIKMAWRKWVAKDPNYEFPTAFYTISIPLLNALMPFALLALGMSGVESPLFGLGWVEILKYIGVILLSSLVSLVGYTAGLKPMTTYAARKAEEREAEKADLAWGEEA